MAGLPNYSRMLAGLCATHRRAEPDVECLPPFGDHSELTRSPPMRRDNILRMVEEACRRGEIEHGDLLLAEIERRMPMSEPPERGAVPEWSSRIRAEASK